MLVGLDASLDTFSGESYFELLLPTQEKCVGPQQKGTLAHSDCEGLVADQ